MNTALATERGCPLRERGGHAVGPRGRLVGARQGRGHARAGGTGTPGRRPTDRALLEEAEAASLRGMLRHVDVLAGLDRVVGILLLLGAFGIVSLGTFLGPFWPFSVGGIVLFIAGVIFLQLAGKLSRMREGSRDSQITASVLLLLFPPFLTAMGIYGLFVLTGDRARRAFAVGRKALEGPRPVVASQVVADREAAPQGRAVGPPARALPGGRRLVALRGVRRDRDQQYRPHRHPRARLELAGASPVSSR